MRAKVMTVMRWYAQDEVKQEESEQNEVDGMKKGADLRPAFYISPYLYLGLYIYMYIKGSRFWCSASMLSFCMTVCWLYRLHKLMIVPNFAFFFPRTIRAEGGKNNHNNNKYGIISTIRYDTIKKCLMLWTWSQNALSMSRFYLLLLLGYFDLGPLCRYSC